MSSTGYVGTEKEKNDKEKEFKKMIEDNASLKLILHELKKNNQHLEFITEERIT